MSSRGLSHIMKGIALVSFSIFMFTISFGPEGLFTQLSYIWTGLALLLFPVIIFPGLFGISSIMWGYYIHTKPRATKLP